MSEHDGEGCCICSQAIGEDAVQLFVFWPGDEDPTPWFAHERCLKQRTEIRREHVAEQKQNRPSSGRNQA